MKPRLLARAMGWWAVGLLVSVAGAEEGGEVLGDELGGVVVERVEPLSPSVRGIVDGGVRHHLGWGTAEDRFIDVGAGVAVSTLSGNVVLHLRPLPRGDVPEEAALRLTWNSMDGEGATELGPGWSMDLLRRLIPGAFGERVLIDGDGFRDGFFAGEPPTEEDVRKLGDRIVDGWRRRTPASERRAVGGEEALRALLASDPLALADLRSRFLGRAPVSDDATTWTSPMRGERRIERVEGGVELRGAHGPIYTFDTLGRMTELALPGGAKGAVERDQERLVAFHWAQERLWTFQVDAVGRIREVAESSGRRASFEWAGPLLHRVRSDAGTWNFIWDEAGRLSSADGPEGRVRLRYDPDTGRAVDCDGPAGAHRLRWPADDRGAVEIDGPSGSGSVQWDDRARTRTERWGSSTWTTTFDPRRPLPTTVADGRRTHSFRWSDSGRLLSAASAGVELRVERGSDGLPTALRSGTERLILTPERGGVVVRDGSGRAQRWAGVQAGTTGMGGWLSGQQHSWRRTHGGALSLLSAPGGPDLDLKRDPRGFVRSVAVGGTGTLFLSRTALGHPEGLDGPGGTLSWTREAGGRVGTLQWGGQQHDLRYDERGLLVGVRSARLSLSISRDGEGRVAAVDGGARGSAELRHGPLGVATLIPPATPPLNVARDAEGRIEGITRLGGGERRWTRDRSGRVAGVEDSAWGKVEFDRDGAGRVSSVRHGVSRWALGRDGGGVVSSVTGPDTVGHMLDLDGSARPVGLRIDGLPPMTLAVDAAGRATGLSVEGRTLRLRRDAEGRVSEATGPRGTVALRWGMDGALTSANIGGLEVDTNHAPAAPVGEDRFDLAGRPTSFAGVALLWGPAGLWSVQRGGGFSTVGRDAFGRIEAWNDTRRSVRLDLDGAGALRALSIREGEGEQRWTLSRDSAARVVSVGDPQGRSLLAALDPWGRLLALHWGEARIHWRWAATGGSGEGTLTGSYSAEAGPGGKGLRWSWSPASPGALSATSWGEGATLSDGGAAPPSPVAGPILPSPWGHGPMLDGVGRLAVPVAGGTLAWLDGSGAWDGLSPPGGTPAGHRPAAQVAGAQGGPLGAPRVVERWAAPDERPIPSTLVPGLAQIDTPAEPSEVRGVGALLPRVPWAGGKGPAPAGLDHLDATALLVATGDLPPALLALREAAGIGDVGEPLEVPGGRWLLDLQERLAAPAVPPGASEPIGRFEPDLRRVVFGVDSRAGTSEVISGLPSGVRPSIPGGGLRPALLPTLPTDHADTALEALHDGPFGAADSWVRWLEEEAALATIWRLSQAPSPPLGPWAAPAQAPERWEIELGPETRVIVDGRGRIVLIDLGGDSRAAEQAYVGAEAAAYAGGLDSAPTFGPPCPRWPLGPWPARAGWQAPPGIGRSACEAWWGR